MNKKWKIVFDYLMYLIRENKVKRGEVLPSQNMLKTKFKYSEQPIRIAFNKLIELQLVKPVNGKGYVVQDKLENNLLFSFRELFPNCSNIYFDLEEITVDKEMSKLTKFYQGTKVLKYKCLRKNKNNEIIIYQESFVPKEIYQKLTLNYLNKNGLMKFIENETNIVISHSSKKICFKSLEEKKNLAEIFQDNSLQGFILDIGNVYSIFGDLIEYRKSYYKPNFFNWDFIEWRH